MFTVKYTVTRSGKSTTSSAGYNYSTGKPPAAKAPAQETIARVAMGKIYAVKTTKNSISVKWDAPTVTGKFSGAYSVRVFDNTGKTVKALTTTERSATFTGLNPDEIYAVNVYAAARSLDEKKSVTGLQGFCIRTLA